MTLRAKTLFITSLVFLLMVVFVVLFSRTFLLASYQLLEDHDMQKNAKRALSVLSNRIDELSRITKDYASWDDTYAFIEDVNPKYIKNNLVDTSFENLKINLMVFIHASGKTVFAKNYDLSAKKEISLPEEFKDLVSPAGSFLKGPETEAKGIVMLPQGALLFACRPILTSTDKGPSRGTLILGRFIDRDIVDLLSKTIELSVIISRVDDPRMPNNFKAAYAFLTSKGKDDYSLPLNNNTIAGYGLAKDVFGKPAVIIRVESPRHIYQQGYTTIQTFQIIFSLAGVISIVTLLFFLEKGVLSRLVRLSADVQQLGKSTDLSTRVSVGGNDELTALGGEMNRMLDSLENSRHDLIKRGEMLDKKTGELENTVADLTKTTTELKAAKTVLEEKMKELEEFHELAVGRELKMIELEKEIERLKREGKI